MKIDIYANYGLLTHEKETVYTLFPAGEHREKLTVDIPDDICVGENAYGTMLVELGGKTYPLIDVLTSHNGAPALAVPSSAKRCKRIKLETV